MRPTIRKILAMIGVAVTASALAVTLAESASASTPQGLHRGKGFAVQPADFVGYYLTSGGDKVYCLNPNRALPPTVSLNPVAQYPGVSAGVSHQLSYALSRWGNASTAVAAAAESQLLNTLVGNNADVARRAGQLPKSVANLLGAHLTETRQFHGPYVTIVHAPTAPLPGQSADGNVVVRSGSGNRMRGIAVLLSSSRNASVPAQIKTGSDGFGRFTYHVTNVGEVHINATAIGLPSIHLRVNDPSDTQQHMVETARRVSSHGSASFQRSPSGFANKYACTTTCNGRPRTTLRACAAASKYASRIAYHYEGKVTYVTYAPSTKLVCKSLAVVLKDGDHVAAAWQFKTAQGWSTPVAAKGSFTVDCPPAAPVGVTMTYDCTAASITIGLAKVGANGTWTPLVNTTTHRMVLVIGGAQHKRIVANHGQSAVFTATAACGSPVNYTAQSGVQRANGQYNYGFVSSLRTPG